VAFSFRALGVAFLAVTLVLSQFIVNPEKPLNVAAPGSAAAKAASADATWREMIRTSDFWLLWLQYAFGATAGLMIIGHLAKIVAAQSNNAIQTGFVFVALLALFNAAGRIVTGSAVVGFNYGILFTAWGVGGVFGPILAGRIADATGSYQLAHQIAAGLLMLATLLAMLSYVGVSVNLPEREVTIRVGRRKPAPEPGPTQAQASG
jgi:OFA family oxalate/formate antiporter-like MFS transporter